MNTNDVLNKLKAEIERLIDLKESRIANKRLNELLSFITSLQQEQPLTVESVVEQCKKFGGNPEIIQQVVDFDNEYKSYIESRKDDLSGNAITVNMKDLARYFYELGLNERREK